ncbi:DUF563 domain-containing protein [Nocardioides sp.]|uniref:glycosyltransferase family 61 protein n=1 Tax=Nocardioides sp. TaxID=35761 RepID=UPI002715D069|nr:glycosyltransferase 61 family protein [Nocardioides sp.]MDO9457325.1 glycosyltransferase 61 family protein [Nocardioides sp.]
MWTPAQPNQAPTGDPIELVTVDDAVVTPFEQGALRTELTGPQGWIRGAVHDSDGILVRASQRRWQGGQSNRVAADPDQIAIPDGARRLEGTWLYVGHWAIHFGHLLVEHLANYWPDPSSCPLVRPLAGILAHRPPHGPIRHPRRRLETPELTSWQSDLIRLAGYDPGALRIVHGRALRVERLVVPSRPVLLKKWAQPEAVRVWERISRGVGTRGPDRRVYLSRTRFHSEVRPDRARISRDESAGLDATFAAAGFAVVHPETLTIAEQVAAVRGADVIAGLSGSAMHLSALAAPGSRILTLGDNRDPTRLTKEQAMIDAACGHLTAFVPYSDHGALDRLLASLD